MLHGPTTLTLPLYGIQDTVQMFSMAGSSTSHFSSDLPKMNGNTLCQNKHQIASTETSLIIPLSLLTSSTWEHFVNCYKLYVAYFGILL